MDQTTLIMWIIIISLYAIGAIIFAISRAKADEVLRKRLMTLVTTFFVSLSISRLFHLLSVLNENDQLLFGINQLFLIIALVFVIFTFENKIENRSRNILTVGLVIAEILYIVFHAINVLNAGNDTYKMLDDVFSLILASMMGIATLSIFYLYFKIAVKSTGIVRRKGLVLSFGIIFLIASYLIFGLSDAFPPETVEMASFAMTVIGVPLLIYGFSLK